MKYIRLLDDKIARRLTCASDGKKSIAASLILATFLAACAPAADSTQSQPAELIADVEKAARAKDFEALSKYMVADFRFSFGREPSREEALSWYRTHPELLDKMANVLNQTCVSKTSGSETYYICPAAAADENKTYYDWRAGFRLKDDGSWEYVWFIAGD